VARKDQMRPNLYYDQGEVTATAPPGNSSVRTGSTVTIFVSAGSTKCATCVGGESIRRKMPPVCGLNFQQAETLLVRQSITLRPPPPNVPASAKIIGSDPPAGTFFVAFGSPAAKEVVVTFSSGQSASSSTASSSAGSRDSC
jgi:beta-lactam-binding protein with PASTA domain